MALNLLVVDDSTVMRAMIIKTLQMSGLELAEVFQAGNGREGLDVLKDTWIDLVVLDINMPVMNGEEMLDHMQADAEMKNIPVIVISTEGSQTRIDRLQHKGARFVRKPFSAEIVRDTIKEIMGDAC